MTDVARAAGVSQKTVSRVVNGEAHVRPDVVRRVHETIEALGFRPNAAARALVAGRSRRIGVVSAGSLLHGPATMLTELERAIREAGYAVALIRTSTDVQQAVDALTADGVDGIVLSPSATPVSCAVPLLTVAAGHAGDGAAIRAGTDERGGARAAVEHLLSLGHRTVEHIAGPSPWAPARQRARGRREALLDAGAPVPDPVEGDWSAASGFLAMRELLGRPGVTAVFAANDHMAIGAMRAIERAGRSVPADVSVVGFDDIPEAEYLSVALTTVRPDPAEVARRGVRRLIHAIDGGAPAPPALVPVRLIVRESSTEPRKHP